MRDGGSSSAPNPRQDEDEHDGGDEIDRVALTDIEFETVSGTSETRRNLIQQSALDQCLGHEQLDGCLGEHGP